MFWRWFGRSARRDVAAGAGSAALALAPAAPERATGTAPAEDENTRPLPAEEARRATRARIVAPRGWPGRDDVAALENRDDPDAIARLIRRADPAVGRDEVLFRYHLARAVWLGEYDLPPLPHSAARVLDLSRSPRASVADYARVVESDPGMVKSVFWLANSSFYASLVQCSSLAQAMVRIGVREVERLAMLQAFQSRVFRVYGQDELVRDIGQHVLATGLAAQAIAQHAGGAQAGDAFLAGLFHDVGKLVVLGVVAQEQRRLKRRAPQRVITSAFDAFHVFVGETACREWGLPEPVVAAVGSHHDPEAAAADPLDRAVYLGNPVARAATSRNRDERPAVRADDPVLAAAGLGPGDLSEICEQVRATLRTYPRMGS